LINIQIGSYKPIIKP